MVTFKIKAKGATHKMTEGLLLKEIPVKDHEKNNKNVSKLIKNRPYNNFF